MMSFQTQKQPILTALAQAFVFGAMQKQTVAWFTNPKLDPRVRHAVATVHKAAVIQASQTANLALGDRCGAQGLFEANQFSAMHARTLTFSFPRPDASDILSTYSLTYAVSQSPKVIRWESPSVRTAPISAIALRLRLLGLASELLLGRYALEPPLYPDSFLARHENGLFSVLRAALAAAPGHRSATYDRGVLPRSLPLVLAIGHRIAYDAARAAQVDAPLLDLFEVSAILQDEAWYVECLGISRAELRRREAHALEAVFARLEEYLVRMDVAPYIVAPIVSDEKWEQFFGTLPTLSESRGVHKDEVAKTTPRVPPFVESDILRKISGDLDTPPGKPSVTRTARL